MRVGKVPFMYLGVLFFPDYPSLKHLRPIADRILDPLASW